MPGILLEPNVHNFSGEVLFLLPTISVREAFFAIINLRLCKVKTVNTIAHAKYPSFDLISRILSSYGITNSYYGSVRRRHRS